LIVRTLCIELNLGRDQFTLSAVADDVWLVLALSAGDRASAAAVAGLAAHISSNKMHAVTFCSVCFVVTVADW